LPCLGGFCDSLQVVKVAGFMQDMVLTACTIAYLLALFVGLVVAARGWSDLLRYFKPKVSKQYRRSSSSRS
jgi:exosortase/archaeosortase